MRLTLYAVCLAVFLGHAARGAEPDAVMIGGEPEPIVIPLEDMGHAGLFVPVMIDGRGPYRFLLDPGSQSFIADSVAENLRLPVEKSVGLTTGYVESTAKIVRTKLTLHGAEVPSDQFYTQPKILDNDRLRFIPDFGGVLGFELLQNYAISIDFDHNTLTLQPSYVPKPGYTVLDAAAAGATGPLGFMQRPAVTVAIDDVSTRLALFFGSSSSVEIDESSKSGKTLLQHAHKSIIIKVDQGKYQQQSALFRAGAIRLGDISTPDILVRIDLTERSEPSWGPTKLEMDGGMGLGFLRRFNLTIDHYGTRVAFSPRSAANLVCVPQPPYYGEGYGAQPQADGTSRIGYVVPGSPAERAGLVIGDVIVTRDGIAAAKGRLLQPGDPLCPVETQAPVHLTVRAGKGTKDITLIPEPLLP